MRRFVSFLAATSMLAAPAVALPEGALRTERPARDFRPDRAATALAERLGVTSLDGFGLERFEAAVGAAGAVVAYLASTWPQALAHLRAPRAVRAADVVYLDPQTRRNLHEPEATLRPTKRHSVVGRFEQLDVVLERKRRRHRLLSCRTRR